jgi:hypothetical protein
MPSQTPRDMPLARLRTPADAQPQPNFLHIDTQRFQDRADACERTARRLRDPIARRIYARTALRWRTTAEQTDDRLHYLVTLLAPPPLAGE